MGTALATDYSGRATIVADDLKVVFPTLAIASVGKKNLSPLTGEIDFLLCLYSLKT